MNTLAIVLLAVHFIFSIVCGRVVCRTYNNKSSYFFKGFLLTLIFGFIGALYFLKNLSSIERRDIRIATFVSLFLVLLVLWIPVLRKHRLDLLVDIPFFTLMVVATIHGFIEGRKGTIGHKLNISDEVYVNYVLSYISISLVCLVGYVCVKALLG